MSCNLYRINFIILHWFIYFSLHVKTYKHLGHVLDLSAGGIFPEKLGGGVRPASQNSYPIYDQNMR